MFQENTAQSLAGVITPSPRFQRAVHLRYDLRDTDTIDRYMPTLNAVTAIDAVLRGVDPHSTQRAHVIHAAYGSGKSLLAVAIAALLENIPQLADTNIALAKRIEELDPATGKRVFHHLNSKLHRRLLPVVLSGDEGDLSTALTRALMRTLNAIDLHYITPQTRFNAAIRTIEDWETTYPDTFKALEHHAKTSKFRSVKILKKHLQESSVEAYSWFEQTYTQLTSGVVFDRFAEKSPQLVFLDVIRMLRQQNEYDGVVVLWDEFGRFLESRTSQAFGTEAAQLQEFAEACSHSGDNQLHLLLFTHKEVQGYASSLPKSYQQEWVRIEGRFQNHNVTGDPHIAYRLIAHSIQHADETMVAQLVEQSNIGRLVSQSVDAHLFGVLTSDEVCAIIERTWPLHPLSVFALTRLSNRVAQNERTLFTFLTVDEQYSLTDVLRQIRLEEEDYFVRPAALWDYFADAVRSNTGAGGVHHIWSGVAHALDKVMAGDALEAALVKTLGVMAICSDASAAKPTTELLSWAVGAETEEQIAAVVTSLENLRRRKVLIRRHLDGFWTFTTGSDIDFELKLEQVLERTNPTNLQLRRLLEQISPAPYTLARRYNQEYAMTRYFTGMYRWADELVDVSWDDIIHEFDNADGLVVYVLAHDEFSLRLAVDSFPSHNQVAFVIPEKPLATLNETLREVFGLQELNNDPDLRQHEDRDRIQRELNWLLEDAHARLQHELHILVGARDGQTEWLISKNDQPDAIRMMSPGQATRVVSELCSEVFSKTPVINSEGLNKRYPTGQQIAAAQRVIDALFGSTIDAVLGLEGHGPEIAALNSILVMTRILRFSEEEQQWIIDAQETDVNLGEVWNQINSFLDSTLSSGRQTLSLLVEQLIAPPFGLRQGVMPIIFSAVLLRRVKATTIRQGDRAVHPITGRLVTEIFARPDEYTIEVSEWSETHERLWQTLYARFGTHIHESERNQQPLTILKVSMLRWLQGLPAFCRDTQKLSSGAVKFRNLIRTAQMEPARVLFIDLPDLLEINADTEQEAISHRLDLLLSEIANAYFDLQRRLDSFAIEQFGAFSVARATTGMSALRGWVATLQANQQTSLYEMRFGSLVTQQVVETILQSEEGDDQFWDHLSQAATGLHIRDWNDQSEAKFRQTLLNTRTDIEREAEELVRGETVVSVSLQLPKSGQKDFRFRASDLTPQGKRLLQNFKSTLEIAGRPLSADEKRQIVVAFLCFVMGESIDE
jgi:hypothetical protein